jgi:hypothetical protein
MAKSLCISDDHAQVRLHETAERDLVTVFLNLMPKQLLVILGQ